MASDDSAALTDDGSFDEIKNLIDNTAENGTVELEGKKYELSDDTHIILNKSINIEGVNGTIIDGNNSSLYFDCVEKESADLDFAICRIGYELKNTGKHITLKNITFTNINLVEWHKMDFLDCNFINTTITNYELDNTYERTNFINSNVVIKNPKGMLPDNFTPDYDKLKDCEFYNSNITSENLFLSNYIELVGSSRFELINAIDMTGCNFSKSNLELTYYTINIDECSFNESKWEGWSSAVNVNSTSVTNQNINYAYSIFNAKNSIFINDSVSFRGGYFSTGNFIAIDNCEINNTELKIDEGMNSGKSVLNITDSELNKCFIDSTFADVTISNSSLNKTKMRLLFTKTVLKNTNLTIDENLSEIFKTYNNTFNFENSYLKNGTGKTELNEKDTVPDNLDELLINEKELYLVGDKLIVTLIDSKGNPIEGESIKIYDPSTKDAFSGYTDENGTLKFTLQRSGQVKLILSTPETFGAHVYSKAIEVSVKSIPIKIIASPITTTYGNKGNLKIKLESDEANATLDGFKLTVKVFTGKKYKTYQATTKANGTATFKTPKNLASGKHKVEITTRDLVSKKVTVTVNKAKTTVKAPKVTNKFKKSQYFKVTVKDKATKKAVSNVKVKVKVYTGKKHITKTIKTNSKGIAKLNTKFLKIGKHKVVISSANNNYKISAKSTIKIK